MAGSGIRAALVPIAIVAALAVGLGARAVRGSDRAGTVSFDIRVAAPPGAKDVKLWFPIRPPTSTRPSPT